MAVFARGAPSRWRSQHGAAAEIAAAFAAVVQRIFPEGFRQPVTRRGSNRRDPEIGPESLAVTFNPLSHSGGELVALVRFPPRRGAGNGYGPNVSKA